MSYFIQTIPILIALVVIEKGVVIFDRNIIKKKYGFSLVEKYRGVFKKISYIAVVLIIAIAIFIKY